MVVSSHPAVFERTYDKRVSHTFLSPVYNMEIANNYLCYSGLSEPEETQWQQGALETEMWQMKRPGKHDAASSDAMFSDQELTSWR